MDNVDKIDSARKVIATGCFICSLALAAKTYITYKRIKDNERMYDEQRKYIFERIGRYAKIQKESDQTNN